MIFLSLGDIISSENMEKGDKLEQLLNGVQYANPNFNYKPLGHNSDLSVEEIQDALKVSRWHLLSKVKSLVGLTPTEFIRETRLAHAAKLIEEGENNMTQITYMIGMTDSRYFSRCFKQKYGVTPTEYKTNKKKN